MTQLQRRWKEIYRSNKLQGTIITGLEASTITGLAKHTSHASIAVNMMESEKLF